MLGQKVEIDGIWIHYERVGTGPEKVLLLPGGLGNELSRFGTELRLTRGPNTRNESDWFHWAIREIRPEQIYTNRLGPTGIWVCHVPHITPGHSCVVQLQSTTWEAVEQGHLWKGRRTCEQTDEGKSDFGHSTRDIPWILEFRNKTILANRMERWREDSSLDGN